MPRRPAQVTQADVARFMRAALQAGGEWQIELRDGVLQARKVESVVTQPEPVEPEEDIRL